MERDTGAGMGTVAAHTVVAHTVVAQAVDYQAPNRAVEVGHGN